MPCDQAKSVWSRSNSVFIFLTNCTHHFHSYILPKNPLKLVSWFQKYVQLKDAKSNGKRRHFLLCLALSLNQYFQLPSDFAWSHHITYVVLCPSFSLAISGILWCWQRLCHGNATKLVYFHLSSHNLMIFFQNFHSKFLTWKMPNLLTVLLINNVQSRNKFW